jgi:hypothetical protein
MTNTPAQPLTVPGTKVRFTMDNLGLVGESAVVNAGDLGYVLGPGPDAGWILVEPFDHPGAICPVSAGMIEAVA